MSQHTLEPELSFEYSVDELATLNTDPPDEPVRVLDVFCGAGGVGYALNNVFTSEHVHGTFLGIDKEPHGDTYPGEFKQLNTHDLTLDTLGLSEPVDLVWLSPPCQAYSKLSHISHDNPKDVHPTFDELGVHDLATRLGKEYVIENVVGCDDLHNPIKLNGPAFNQPFIYERLFETSFDVNSWLEPPQGGEIRMCDVGEKAQARAKGIPDHWEKTAIRSAIPPVYTGYLLSHCPTLQDIHPDNARDAYRQCGAGNGQRWLSEYATQPP